MTERLTAKQAHDLARAKDPAFALDAILAGIEKASLEGRYEYITRNYGFGSSQCYAAEEKYPALCQVILKELRDLGYKARVQSECRQFVDLWLSVTWEKI